MVLDTDCAVRLDTTPTTIPHWVHTLFDKRGAAQTNREYRNALVALAPDVARLIPLRRAVVEYLAWKHVEESEQGKQLTSEQKRTLTKRMKDVEDNLPSYVRATYNVLLDLDEEGNLRAQTLKSPDALGIKQGEDVRPFARIKATLKGEDRLIVDELAPELLLPGSYYELWAPGETAKKAQEILTAFAKFPRLPRFLSAQIFRNTLARGCSEGAMALRLHRPDKTFRTLWRVRPSNEELSRPELEVLPAEQAELTELDPVLLTPGILPNLWKSPTEPILLYNMADYYNGKNAPTLKEGLLVAAVSKGVQLGILWVRTPTRSYLKELLPVDALTDTLELLAPPPALKSEDLLPNVIPNVWDNKEAELDTMWSTVGAERGYAVPWVLMTEAIEIGLQQRLWEVSPNSIWPCGEDRAGQVVLTLGVKSKVKESHHGIQSPLPNDTVTAGGAITALELSKIADILSDLTTETPSLTFSYELFITAKGEGADTASIKLNAILGKASSKIKFGG
ncbi:MAG: hypothetical protein NT023_05880 [Armatimonadetes bacterium]|nr:hypothetical protein [Armatimonadota bacterium]